MIGIRVLFAFLTFAIDAVELGFAIVVLCVWKELHDDSINSVDDDDDDDNDDDCTDIVGSINRKDVKLYSHLIL